MNRPVDTLDFGPIVSGRHIIDRFVLLFFTVVDRHLRERGQHFSSQSIINVRFSTLVVKQGNTKRSALHVVKYETALLAVKLPRKEISFDVYLV